MPIVDIETVGVTLEHAVIEELAAALGMIFESPPGTTWVRARVLEAHQYAENGPRGTVAPTFVSLTHRDDTSVSNREKEARRVATRVAEITGRPEANIHIIYQPAARERIAFGGKLVT